MAVVVEKKRGLGLQALIEERYFYLFVSPWIIGFLVFTVGPMIASVFINRLNVGMKLDSDPTVQYAIGFNKEQNTWWTNPLNLDDLKIDSPYNTYLNTKLPPGPIANPGLEALQAVAFPARTPYFFFRAACDGSGRHLFSKTYDEHIHNECK